MAGRRRGRTGRGWDAAPPRARRSGGRKGPAVGNAATGVPGEPVRDPAELAREICLRQLAVRPRTRAELATALRRGGIPDAVASQVLERYSEVGMIDDAAFARAWVSSRHHGKGLARRALGSELRQRGVAPETVGEALDQLDTDTEVETARALVDRKLRTATGDPQAITRRLVGMLARKGYPAGVAYRVVKEALAADDRTAAFADQLDPDALADAAGEEPTPG
jgi:regulatory protein